MAGLPYIIKFVGMARIHSLHFTEGDKYRSLRSQHPDPFPTNPSHPLLGGGLRGWVFLLVSSRETMAGLPYIIKFVGMARIHSHNQQSVRRGFISLRNALE